MHVTSGSHLWPKIDRKDFISLVLGPLMIGLSCLPQSLLAGPAEGKTIYQQKCVACHTIGGGRLVGPDLKGVTSLRDSAWLVRWIQEPDKMLAEGDPIATAQLKQYGIPMPALGVSEAQAKDIIAYMESESAGGPEVAAPTTATVATATVATVATAPASPENGKNIFAKTCSACHTIGQGDGVGPDLKGVTSRRDITWLLRWIQEPEKMRAEGDSIATQLLKEHKNFPMPNYALSENDANDILGYIAAESGDEAPPVMRSAPAAAPQEPMVAAAPSAGDPVIGRALFVGEKRLINGAPSCMSCHGNADIPSLGGGSLGPDLTTVHSRMGGDIGLKSVIVSAPFPTMQAVFSKKPVTEEEAIHLTAYFAQTKGMTEKALNFQIVGISLGGFIFMYILLHLIWRNRLTGVRKPLVGR